LYAVWYARILSNALFKFNGTVWNSIGLATKYEINSLYFSTASVKHAVRNNFGKMEYDNMMHYLVDIFAFMAFNGVVY